MSDRLLGALSGLCALLTGIAMVVLTVIFGWLVYGRYVLNSTPTWVEQVSLLLVVLITFIGAAVGVYERTHLSVEFFRARCPRTVRLLLFALSHLVMTAFGAAMAVAGYRLTLFKWGSDIPLLGVPEGLRTIPLSVAGGLIVLFSLSHLWRLWRDGDEAERVDLPEG